MFATTLREETNRFGDVIPQGTVFQGYPYEGNRIRIIYSCDTLYLSKEEANKRFAFSETDPTVARILAEKDAALAALIAEARIDEQAAKAAINELFPTIIVDWENQTVMDQEGVTLPLHWTYATNARVEGIYVWFYTMVRNGARHVKYRIPHDHAAYRWACSQIESRTSRDGSEYNFEADNWKEEGLFHQD